jgi:hypothetical protein
MWKKFEIF